MFIAFEGPDEVGKSTSAKALDCAGQPDYNATKTMHARNVAEWNGDASTDPMPHTYDRIDWFTHMVYRLALPEKEWNDDRPRTVFAMPDTHLVLKMHNPEYAAFIEAHGEGYAPGRLVSVNEMYWHQVDFLMNLNRHREYSLFKSITIVEVLNDQKGTFRQRIVDHDSAGIQWGSAYTGAVENDEQLLVFLQHVNHQIG